MLQTLIEENKNLIYSVAHRFGSPAMIEDLFQVGCIGIINAYKNYNPSYQVKFSTYAFPYIEGEMKKFIRENKGLKVSREMNRIQLKIEKASILLSQHLMREPSTLELAHFLEIPENVVIDAIRAKESVKSLDDIVSEDEKVITLLDTLKQTESLDLDTLVALKSAISKLSPEERILIEQRYVEDQTQAEVAHYMGMSQVQVSRKEQKVLVKLKNKLVA